MKFINQSCRPQTRLLPLLAFTVLFLMSVGADAQTSRPAGSPDAKTAGDPYPLDICIVSGEKLGDMGDVIVYLHEGREVRFCCPPCISKFEADAQALLKKIDQLIIERQLPYYPLETCIVSDEELGGEMGKPIEYVFHNRLVRLCCRGCIRDFKNDRVAYLKKIDAAIIKQQKKDYPLDICMVSGEKLESMGGSIDRVFNNRLVRFCCSGCVPKFEKEPAKYLATLDAAWGKQHGDHDRKHEDDRGHDRKRKHDDDHEGHDHDDHSGHNH